MTMRKNVVMMTLMGVEQDRNKTGGKVCYEITAEAQTTTGTKTQNVFP